MKKIIVFMVLVCINFAQAEHVRLESYAKNLDSIPVAIVPFSVTGVKLTENEPWKVIASDLEFSGRFSVNKLTSTDSSLLLQKNIPLYINGTCIASGSDIELECFLRDAHTGDILLSKKTQTSQKEIRSNAHDFCNRLIETLFAGKGIFRSKIIFVKDEGAKKNICMMDWDGADSRTLISNGTINIFPSFADSGSFLFTSFIRGHSNIYRASFSGKQTYLVPSKFTDTSPAQSPIDGRIAFASSRDGNMEIYVCDANGADIKRLTFSKSIETSPCWSPNGYQIAYTSDRVGQPQIYVMDADGANVRKLLSEGGYQDSPAWSPKGDKIAFHMITGGKFDIFTANADGTNVFMVTKCPGNNEFPSWAADGEHLVFSSERGGKTDLYGIGADGRHLRRLTTSGNAKMPDWSQW